MNILRIILCALAFLAPGLTRAAAPLALHPDNPHYFLFRNQPTIIITSGEHYGAVMNLDFDYGQYLAALESAGMNGTRTFTGVYLEPPGAFNISENTMAPANGRYIGPWPRTAVPGARHGGGKFDLKKWNDTYFGRLRDFVRQAGQRGVIVEMTLFCPFYEEMQWALSPMNASNNVNGIGAIGRTNVYTMDKNGGLLPIQEALVRKIVSELNQFDNLYYEICNEPYFGGVTLDWQSHIADVIVDAERRLPNKHLISQNIANGSASASGVNSAVSIYNFHYASPPTAVATNYNANKVIGDNETGFRGTADFPYRREAWEFILAGGGLFNHLDYSFTVRHPRGTYVNYPPNQPGGGNPGLREQFRNLQTFMRQFDFLRMKPDPGLIVGGLPPGGSASAMSDTNSHFALYISTVSTPLNADNYSVRWTGKLRAPKSGEFNFYTLSNDGVRLSIDGRSVIDNWTPHSEKEITGVIKLQAGKIYDFRLEYFQAGGGAVIRLGWKPPGGARSQIPSAVFATAKKARGLDAEYYSGQNFETLAFRRVDQEINFDWSAKSPFENAAPPTGLKTAALKLNIGAGNFVAKWTNPRTGQQFKTERFRHANGPASLTSPAFDEDIALYIHRAAPEPTGKKVIQIGP